MTFIDIPPEVQLDLDAMDGNECRECLAQAIMILKQYPKGQSDCTWRRNRQWFLESFLPEGECE